MIRKNIFNKAIEINYDIDVPMPLFYHCTELATSRSKKSIQKSSIHESQLYIYINSTQYLLDNL